MADDKCKNIKKIVTLALKNEDLSDCEVEIEGQTNLGEGYSGDIYFAKAKGSCSNGSKKTLNLAIKLSANDESIAEAYHMEVHIYDVVKKAFERFRKEKNLEPKIDIMPYCYGTQIQDGLISLVFENLKERNFSMWDKLKPLPHKHVELLLDAYAQWHALSLALRSQQPEVFKKLIENQENVYGLIMIRLKMDQLMFKSVEDTKKLLFEENDQRLKHLTFTQDDITFTFKEMYFEDPDYAVILHGDCWNNNYLFQSLDDKMNPSKAYILDWQCASVGSPAMDVSQFIFSCADTKNYTPKDLLMIYHNSLSKNLRLLGCNPEQVFPFEKLIQHWRRFSRCGLFVSCLFLRLSLWDKDCDPDNNAEQFSEFYRRPAVYYPRYLERVRNNYHFYCKSFEE